MKAEWLRKGWYLEQDERLDPYGVVAVGGPLSTPRLVDAYSKGIFPWPHEEQLLWFCPPRRGVLFFNELRVNKRLQRAYLNSGLSFSRNKNFDEVMRGCGSAPRRGQTGTWITPDMLKAYHKFHEASFAHSFEVWREDKLIAGLYGVLVAGVFSGESVFGTESDVAKFALISCIEWLQNAGFRWMDVQMVTPLTQSFGARYLSRSEYFELLRKTHDLL